MMVALKSVPGVSTVMVTSTLNPAAGPVAVEVNEDGTPHNPADPAWAHVPAADPADEPITLTRAELADMIATAAAAAVAAQADQATTTTIRAAALDAITPTDTA